MTKIIQNLESGEPNSGEAQDSAMSDLVHSLRVAFEKYGPAIKMDTQLLALASATGESVSKLYEFQRGLEAVGEKDASLPGIFAHAQKALSGTNEQGSQAETAFAQLGLKMDLLRGKDTTDVVLRIADSLEKLKPDQAAEIARQLFGKSGADPVLQIGRNMDLFQWEMSKASNTGGLLEKFSKTFQEMNASRNDLEGDILGIRAATVGKNAANIQKIFTIIHDDIKNIGPAIASDGSLPTDVINGALKKLKIDLAPFTVVASKSPDNANDTFGDANAFASGINLGNLKPSKWHEEFTSLEKMGFVMSGSNNFQMRQIDLLQQIANNTASKNSSHGDFTPAPYNTL